VAGGGWRGEGGELGWAGAGGAHHSVYRQRSERTERPMTSMSASRHSWQQPHLEGQEALTSATAPR
jgi:hypothetical protein